MTTTNDRLQQVAPDLLDRMAKQFRYIIDNVPMPDEGFDSTVGLLLEYETRLRASQAQQVAGGEWTFTDWISGLDLTPNEKLWAERGWNASHPTPEA